MRWRCGEGTVRWGQEMVGGGRYVRRRISEFIGINQNQ